MKEKSNRLKTAKIFGTLASWLVWSLAWSATSAVDPAAASARAAAFNQSLFHGTYRPNLYFGTRTRSNPTLLTGLMWYGPEGSNGGFQDIRHTCEQSDAIKGYAWKHHDGREYGTQHIYDSANNVILTTEFLKKTSFSSGGDWVVRISGKVLDPTLPNMPLSVVYYAALEETGQQLKISRNANDKVTVHGNADALGGKFSFHITGNDSNKWTDAAVLGASKADAQRPRLASYHVPSKHLWRVKDLLMERTSEFFKKQSESSLMAAIRSRPLVALQEETTSKSHPANLVITQLMLTLPFSVEVAYLSESGNSHDESRVNALSGDALTKEFQYASNRFHERFERTFRLSSRKAMNPERIDFAKLLLSNMIGGLGYFHGTSVVDRSRESETDIIFDLITEERTAGSAELFEGDGDYSDDHYDDRESKAKSARVGQPNEEGPYSLFTAVPSRPFFPRGFLWDEGFHQLLISRWDPELSMDILKHWAALMDSNGWVAREQILGEEARSKVPEKFQIQYPHYANPPTLLFAFEYFLDGAFKPVAAVEMAGSDLLATYLPSQLYQPELSDLKALYESFKLRYEWFLNTQWGEISEWEGRAEGSRGYRWRGRTEGHTLTSGLDDYPRSPLPHSGELHVDLHAWMAYYAKVMYSAAVKLNETEDASYFQEEVDVTMKSLFDLYWDKESKTFTDLSVNAKGQSYHVVHKGYISLFPFFLGLLDEEGEHYGHALDLIASMDDLWTDFGLASLSKQDPFFSQDEDYWRGSIWININYLVLSRLHNYAGVKFKARARHIYSSLRADIMTNTFEQYKKTGYPWEQYSPFTGEGRRSHPFTGWTSLVVLIMAEMY